MPSSSFYFTSGNVTDFGIPKYYYADLPSASTNGDLVHIVDRDMRLAIADGTYWRYPNGWRVDLDGVLGRTDTEGSFTWTWDTDVRVWRWTVTTSMTNDINITTAGTVPDGLEIAFHAPGLTNGYSFTVNGIPINVAQWIRLISIGGALRSIGRIDE